MLTNSFINFFRFNKNITVEINDRFYFDYKNKTIIKIKQNESVESIL